jgi:hypothetical protein
LSSQPKFPLYSSVECCGDRPGIAAIRGKRAQVVARSQRRDGSWLYKVSPETDASFFDCLESELIPVEPRCLVSDEEMRADFVAQTAMLRYSVRDVGLRNLLRQRNVDPMTCLQIGCEQGDDVGITLVLRDGRIVNADYREHYQTRQAISFSEWSVETYTDREIELARRIAVAADTSQFDDEVQLFFEENIAATDGPLAPLRWGDRVWHFLEKPPPDTEL